MPTVLVARSRHMACSALCRSARIRRGKTRDEAAMLSGGNPAKWSRNNSWASRTWRRWEALLRMDRVIPSLLAQIKASPPACRERYRAPPGSAGVNHDRGVRRSRLVPQLIVVRKLLEREVEAGRLDQRENPFQEGVGKRRGVADVEIDGIE